MWLRGGFVGITDSLRVRNTVDADAGGDQPPAEATPAALPPADVPRSDGYLLATFASGCFWCTEADFDKLQGVVSTTSGYTGGRVPNPTYRQVSAGVTGHAEAVQVVFDPAVVTYEQLLDLYWHNVDPFTAHRQFCDTGDQYRPSSSSTARPNVLRRRLRRSGCRPASAIRSWSRSHRRPRSIAPRSITRTTTREIPPSIGSIAMAAAVTRGSMRFGDDAGPGYLRPVIANTPRFRL